MAVQFSSELRAGFESLKFSKLRSFWTMMGIIIGVAAVITIVAIGEGIKSQVGGQIHHYGSNIITVRTAQLNVGSGNGVNNTDALSGLSVSGPLTLRDVRTVATTPGVNSSSPLSLVTGYPSGDYGTFKQGFAIGTSQDFPSLINQSLQYGNYFNNTQYGSYVAVLGENAAEKLFDEDVPLGRTFMFHGHQFTVNGIFNQYSFTPLSQQADFNNAIFIPDQIAEQLTNNTAPTYEILARANSLPQIGLVAKNIKQALNTSHGGVTDFSVLTGNQNIVANNSILDLLTKLIAGVAAISLVVAGIGIMNVMMVSVSERIREIGIRKAVGATNSQIYTQFMIEASLISLIGGLLGISLAYFIDLAILAATDFTPIIPWQIVIISSGISLLVGIVFGTIPAIKAAAKDPIDALRAE
ncbi:MAG TPA: ABC transporter permease [Candidatus Sulfotelmatobacter sp.]|nr:ABC transporter permease [Candidatus Sulfotelmatobacter sp.]